MLNRATIEKTLPRLLRGVVRLCVRYGVKIGDVERALKPLFVEEATALLRADGESINASRLSVLTGLQRPAITQIMDDDKPRETSTGVSLVMKVVGAWQSKGEFTTSNGKPRVLGVEGKQSEFADLVFSVSGALNPYTVLRELERAKLVERTPRGLRLLSSSFVVHEDVELGLQFLASDLEDLTTSVEENLNRGQEPVNHHLTTEYDRIPTAVAEEVRQLLLEEGHKVHARVRGLVAPYDKDISGESGREKTVRVSFCSFSRIHSNETGRGA